VPGTIVVVEAVPYAELNPQRRNGLIQQPRYRVKVDGTVRTDTVGLPAHVKVDPGTHVVRVVVGGYRTNTVAVEVGEGARHVIHVTPTALRKSKTVLAVAFGAIGGLVAAALPGMYWRVEHPQA